MIEPTGLVPEVLSVCRVCVAIPFLLDVRLVDVPAGVTQEKGHTGFLIRLPSAVLSLIFIARRIRPSLSLVRREDEFCVPSRVAEVITVYSCSKSILPEVCKLPNHTCLPCLDEPVCSM